MTSINLLIREFSEEVEGLPSGSAQKNLNKIVQKK